MTPICFPVFRSLFSCQHRSEAGIIRGKAISTSDRGSGSGVRKNKTGLEETHLWSNEECIWIRCPSVLDDPLLTSMFHVLFTSTLYRTVFWPAICIVWCIMCTWSSCIVIKIFISGIFTSTYWTNCILFYYYERRDCVMRKIWNSLTDPKRRIRMHPARESHACGDVRFPWVLCGFSTDNSRPVQCRLSGRLDSVYDRKSK